MSESRRDWSRLEVEAVVADYFDMLAQELAGQAYNKSLHRRNLLQKLRDRSEGSVELKHQNISAILVELGQPWIIGYKPMRNYQGALLREVMTRLVADTDLERIVNAAIERPAIVPAAPDFQDVLVPAPVVDQASANRQPEYQPRSLGVKRNYLEQECRNRSLGRAGEQFVVAYERHRLHQLGVRKLADRVEHVAVSKGDGLGFDVHSFEVNGRDKLIEVKTTAFGKEAPFYVTRHELETSRHCRDVYHL